MKLWMLSLALAFTSLGAGKAVLDLLTSYSEKNWWMAVVLLTCALVMARTWMKAE